MQQAWVTAALAEGMGEAPMTNPHGTRESTERRALVRGGLQALSPEYRTFILLRDVAGLSYEEISEVLQLDREAVTSRLHQARMALKALLEPYIAGEG